MSLWYGGKLVASGAKGCWFESRLLQVILMSARAPTSGLPLDPNLDLMAVMYVASDSNLESSASCS